MPERFCYTCTTSRLKKTAICSFLSMTDYSLTTQKSWHETLAELEHTMQLWGVTEWEVNYPRGARSQAWQQSEADRTVKLTYTKNFKPITLMMGKQNRAVDNLRVLYLAVEAMRMNEKRGIGDVIESVYLQLAAPTVIQDPYEVLEIRPNASLEIAEAAYKATYLCSLWQCH
jgi:hypothetical protein